MGNTKQYTTLVSAGEVIDKNNDGDGEIDESKEITVEQ